MRQAENSVCPCFAGSVACGLLRWAFWDLNCSVSVVQKAPEGNVQPGSLYDRIWARRVS